MPRPRPRPSSLVGAALALVLLAACSDPASPTPAPTDSALTTVSVRDPIGFAEVGDDLWVVSARSGAVRLDAATPAVADTVEVGRTPLRAAADGDLLWVSVFGSGEVVAVDTASATVTRRAEVGGGPEGIGVAFDFVWVVRQDDRELTRLDRAGTVVGRTPLGKTPRLLGFGASAVWVSDFADGTLTRVDPVSGESTVSGPICDGAQGMAVSPAAVWVACTKAGEVVGVDPTSLAILGRVPVSGEPDGIRLVGDALLVASTDGPTLYQLEVDDPAAPAVAAQWRVADVEPLRDRANIDLIVHGGYVWISSPGDDAVYRMSWPPAE